MDIEKMLRGNMLSYSKLKQEREMLIGSGYDRKDVDQMTDDEVAEELMEIPYNL